MKRSVRVVMILVLALTLSLAVYIINAGSFDTGSGDEFPKASAPSSIENPGNKTYDPGVPDLVISGTVSYSELEGGYYELDGYRLVGDYDFSLLEDGFAVAVGELDESPGIYMVRTIKVRDILSKDDPEFVENLEKLINEYTAALEKSVEDKKSAELISNNLAQLQIILSKSDEADNGDVKNDDGLIEGNGKFIGQADSNFIEIELDDGTLRVFRLGDSIKEKFSEYGLDTNDGIKFYYREVAGENPVIEKLDKR